MLHRQEVTPVVGGGQPGALVAGLPVGEHARVLSGVQDDAASTLPVAALEQGGDSLSEGSCQRRLAITELLLPSLIDVLQINELGLCELLGLRGRCRCGGCLPLCLASIQLALTPVKKLLELLLRLLPCTCSPNGRVHVDEVDLGDRARRGGRSRRGWCCRWRRRSGGSRCRRRDGQAQCGQLAHHLLDGGHDAVLGAGTLGRGGPLRRGLAQVVEIARDHALAPHLHDLRRQTLSRCHLPSDLDLAGLVIALLVALFLLGDESLLDLVLRHDIIEAAFSQFGSQVARKACLQRRLQLEALGVDLEDGNDGSTLTPR